jgi:DNA (cytosine-5)-methyltransferase 1
MCLNAGGMGRQDAESETLIPVNRCGFDDVLPFDTTQITSASNYSNPQTGDPCHPLAAGAHAPCIAFNSKDNGNDASEGVSPTLRSLGAYDANGGASMAVAYDLRGREGGAQFEGPHDTANIRACDGGSSRSYVQERWAVRRLTPTECERLQGFPDGLTDIEWRGKPNAPDGPRYKALGNSMAVNVMTWISERIEAVEQIRHQKETLDA